MSFFSRLENILENVIEGTLLSRLRTRVQPIEIARGLWREITAHKRVGVKGTYIPNYFLVNLSPGDSEFMEPILETVEDEILEHLKGEAEKRDFKTLGPMVIRWIRDENTREGEFLISSDFLKRKELPPDIREKASPHKKSLHAAAGVEKIIYRGTGGDNLTAPADNEKLRRLAAGEKNTKTFTGLRALLFVIDGFEKGKVFQVRDEKMTLGRREDCEIPIWDPRVSHKHAVIFPETDGIYIEDAGSKTGIFVNDEKTERRLLKDGDLIRIGITIIRVEIK